jgi:hypothetical protein
VSTKDLINTPWRLCAKIRPLQDRYGQPDILDSLIGPYNTLRNPVWEGFSGQHLNLLDTNQTFIMKHYGAAPLLVGFAAAHSQVLSITFDGTNYPARSALDASIGANRIEWKSGSPFTFMPISNLKDPAITCTSRVTPYEFHTLIRQARQRLLHQKSRRTLAPVRRSIFAGLQ